MYVIISTVYFDCINKMSLNAIVHLKCAGCDIFLKKSGGRKKLVRSTEEAHSLSNLLNKTISVNDILCNKCRLSTYKIKKNPDRLSECETDLQVECTTDPTFQIAVKSKKDVSNIEYIQIPLQRTVLHRTLLITIAAFVLREKI